MTGPFRLRVLVGFENNHRVPWICGCRVNGLWSSKLRHQACITTAVNSGHAHIHTAETEINSALKELPKLCQAMVVLPPSGRACAVDVRTGPTTSHSKTCGYIRHLLSTQLLAKCSCAWRDFLNSV